MKLTTEMIERLRDTLLEEGRRPTLVPSSAYGSLTREALLTPREQDELEWVDPIGEVMFLMMRADREGTEREKTVLKGALRDLTGGVLRSGTLDVLLEHYEERVATAGWRGRLEAAADILSRDSLTSEVTYTLAAAMALADDQVTLEENKVIDRLAELLGLTDERCCELLEMARGNADPPWVKT